VHCTLFNQGATFREGGLTLITEEHAKAGIFRILVSMQGLKILVHNSMKTRKAKQNKKIKMYRIGMS
jgi:hypothetical protein